MHLPALIVFVLDYRLRGFLYDGANTMCDTMCVTVGINVPLASVLGRSVCPRVKGHGFDSHRALVRSVTMEGHTEEEEEVRG